MIFFVLAWNSHAPTKTRIITQPNAPQINSQLRKDMYSKRMSQNKHWFDKNNNKLFEDFKRKKNFLSI